MAAESSEDVYLAEKVVDSGFGQQDGKRYYKVKWVRFTWELEEAITIKLKDLLDAFWAEHGGDPAEKDKTPIQPTEATNISPTSKPIKDEEGIVGLTTVGTDSQDTPMDDDTTSVEFTIPSTGSTAADMSTSYDENGKEIKYITLEKHECDVCYRSYSSAQALKTHRKSHQPERSYQCDTCLKSFAERSTLKRHMFIHLKEKPFKCDDCDRAFSDKSTLRRHMITHTGAKRFQCSRCDKRFTRNEHLRQHMYIHTAEKLYRCEICSKNFRQRSTRKNHMLLHRAENMYKCEACDATFSKQNLYEKHIIQICKGGNNNTQDGLKCSECDKKFPDRNSLKRHQLIHADDRPFKCDHCDQSFNDRSVLRRHAFTHEERKPFQCNICHKDFIRKASLHTHMATQHPSIEQQSPVFNLVQPVTYNINEGITLDPQSLDQHVQFVIHNPDADVVENAISQVEVSSNKVQNDGVSMLAHAVCNIPQDVLTVTGADSSQVLTVDKSVVTTAANVSPPAVAGGVGNQEAPLQIQLAQDAAIQPGDNQLLQVQIIRMTDGNQFVQSIQAIVQGDDKDYGEADLVVDESHVIGIREEERQNPIITGGDSMISHPSPNDDDSSNKTTPNLDNEDGEEQSYTNDSNGALHKSTTYTPTSAFSAVEIQGNSTATSLDGGEPFSATTAALVAKTDTYTPSFSTTDHSVSDVTDDVTNDSADMQYDNSFINADTRDTVI